MKKNLILKLAVFASLFFILSCGQQSSTIIDVNNKPLEARDALDFCTGVIPDGSDCVSETYWDTITLPADQVNPLCPECHTFILEGTKYKCKKILDDGRVRTSYYYFNEKIITLNGCLGCLASLSPYDYIDRIIDTMEYRVSKKYEFEQMYDLYEELPDSFGECDEDYVNTALVQTSFVTQNCYARCYIKPNRGSIDGNKVELGTLDNNFQLYKKISCGEKCCERRTYWCYGDKGDLEHKGPEFFQYGEGNCTYEDDVLDCIKITPCDRPCQGYE